MRIRIALLIYLFAITWMPVTSQVVARQGMPSQQEVVFFKSPMILEFPLPDLRSLDLDDKQRITRFLLPDVEKYRCDSAVSLLALAVTARRKDPISLGRCEIEITGQVSVAVSHDRKVDLACSMKRAESVIAKGLCPDLKAPEDKSTPFKLLLPIDELDLRTILGGQIPTIVELTLTVRSDK